MDTSTAIVLSVIAVVAIAAIAWFLWNARRRRLQTRFGPEYHEAIAEYGDRAHAEQELLRREKRRSKLHIRALSPVEQERFANAWRADQSHFVDHPDSAIEEAHRLVTEVMSLRGYPVSDFEQQAADLSVDHPLVVRHYRLANDVYERRQRGEATTEELREAMIHYRTLFEQLVDRRVTNELETNGRRTHHDQQRIQSRL
jgi:hypothetical protein